MTTHTEPRDHAGTLPGDHPLAEILVKVEQAARAGVPVEQVRDHVVGMIDAYVDACEPVQRARGWLLETLAINDAPPGQQEQARKAADELEAACLTMASDMTMAVVRAWYPRRPAAAVQP